MKMNIYSQGRVTLHTEMSWGAATPILKENIMIMFNISCLCFENSIPSQCTRKCFSFSLFLNMQIYSYSKLCSCCKNILYNRTKTYLINMYYSIIVNNRKLNIILIIVKLDVNTVINLLERCKNRKCTY